MDNSNNTNNQNNINNNEEKTSNSNIAKILIFLALFFLGLGIVFLVIGRGDGENEEMVDVAPQGVQAQNDNVIGGGVEDPSLVDNNQAIGGRQEGVERGSIFPDQNLPEEEKRRRFDLLRQEAQDVNEWVVDEGCVARPVVVKKDGPGIIAFKNNTSRERVLGFNEENEITIPAGSTINFDLNTIYQGRGAGVYGVVCDRNKEFGLLFIDN